jgi:1-acyl-sn-glycerol-3-phosphate acyltransferase
MQIVKNVFGTLWAVWAIVLFAVTMFIFMAPVLFIYFMNEPGRTHLFIKSAQIWMGVYMPLIGCPVTVKGKNNFQKNQNYIVVCNHNSLMDVPVSSPGIPGGNKTIAKVEFAKTPVFGVLYKMGSVLVDRKSEHSRRDSFNKMKTVLQMGLHMCLYPEGTRNKTGEPLKAFHDGAFRLAIETGKPLMPAIIFNTKKVLPANRKFCLLPKALHMHFLAPVYPQQFINADQLKQHVFDVMWQYYVVNQKNY